MLQDTIEDISDVRHMPLRVPAGLVGLSCGSDRRKLVDIRSIIGLQNAVAMTISTTAKTMSGHEAIRIAASAVASNKCQIENRGRFIERLRQAGVPGAFMLVQ
jgi:hypothetical protein